jgi:hypothetical protein
LFSNSILVPKFSLGTRMDVCWNDIFPLQAQAKACGSQNSRGRLSCR